MDFSLQSHKSFIGLPATELPTPSLVLSKPVIENNIQQLLDDVKHLNIAFRPHVKTLKSTEVTRMMLGNGRHRRIVASTLCEIRGAIALVQEGILDEILYGLPLPPSALPHLTTLAKTIPNLKILLMIDNPQQITHLEKNAESNPTLPPWPVFIKVDVGSHRAGLETSSPSLPDLVKRVEESNATHVYGFYCHAGHSYACKSSVEAEKVLGDEIGGVLRATEFLGERKDKGKVVVSVGSTPTAHVVKALKESMPGSVEVELHAGNYPANDLQQLNTGLVTSSQQAVRILAEVCSVYPERNEALVNAGTIALAKETSDSPGYGRVVDKPQWSVVRMAQEHGILGFTGAAQGKEKVGEAFRVGDKVWLYIQHACITAAAHHVYYVVDEGDVVRETWVPWKGW
ncbi:D-serine ammonia-lyase DSD1 [Aspergillus ruber CBS 135680]|uniref:D-serine dehydratase n=1 Tax=Aspergillus ruber (strain CBS 135680) TaxID=1388766 RepID=A0A017S5D6_ASPRC|nr:uncharacterized protein EURHEDRAFT_533449 [Aspergillus ruber CBS 135680]EYE91849.1 hypothetical protein EURHEDRAFT_533449 [Aspergillus ruber CBS 135680]